MDKQIAIVTDSNSGIFPTQAEEMGVHTVPMPFCVDGNWMYEGKDLSQREFYQLQQQGATITSSQPAPQDITDLWDTLLQEYETIVYIPMTSGLSGSTATAIALAQEYNGRVQVVDNRRISLTQLQSIRDAQTMVSKGMSAQQIKDTLEQEGSKASIYLAADTLKYLKKGGRITPAAAAIGTVLNIKPVLQIQGGGVDAFAKVRGLQAAMRTMLEAMEKDLTVRFAGVPMRLGVAYSGDPESAKAWYEMVQQRFPGYEVEFAPLSLSIGCHTGPGTLCIGCYSYYE